MFPWNEVVVPRVAELPTCQNNVRVRQTIFENNGRGARGRERAAYLKDEQCIRVAKVVERQRSGQLSGVRKEIDAGSESHSAQVLTSECVCRRQAHGCVVSRGQITLLGPPARWQC